MTTEINAETSFEFMPRIAPAIWQLRPDFAALSIVAKGCINTSAMDWTSQRLAAAGRVGAQQPDWAVAHLAAWQDAFRAFGAKPQRTPCSAEALRKRIERGGALPPVNAVVDVYNAVSIEFALPVGGEDVDHYVSAPELTLAHGDEHFETMKDGQPAVENPDRGEVIWRDRQGVTCRRWNWRQGPRTRIDIGTRSMWFVLERLQPMPLDELLRAGDVLCGDLARLSPGVVFSKCLLQMAGCTNPV